MTSKVIKGLKRSKTVRFIMYSHRYYKLIRKREGEKRRRQLNMRRGRKRIRERKKRRGREKERKRKIGR